MSALLAGYGAQPTAFDRVLAAAETVTATAGRRAPNGTTKTRCPVPDHGRGRGDRNPSLALTPADGKVLVICDAGCHIDDILGALGLTPADLFDEPKERRDAYVPLSPGCGHNRPRPHPATTPTQPRPASASRPAQTPPGGPWVYTDDQGTPVYRAVRHTDSGGKKRFDLERPIRDGGWASGIKQYGITPFPYNWPAVLAAIAAGAIVFIPEGEKCAQALIDAGLTATTNHGGAAQWATYCARYTPHFTGARIVVLPDNDGAGQRHADQVVETLAPVAQIAVVNLPGLAEKGDVYDWLQAGGTVDRLLELAEAALTPPTAYTVTNLADVQPERVSWLWDGRLPAGKLTIVDGDPGVGKSTLALEIAATVSTGARWFDGRNAPRGNVLLLSGEDGLADTVRPRLDAAGADSARVHALVGIKWRTEDGVAAERDPHLGDIAAIEAAIRAHHVTLVIVDVLMAFLPVGVDSYKDQDARTILRPLAGVAERTGAAIILLRHLNKGQGTALQRGGGSIGIVGAARAGYLAVKDPDDPNRVILAATKCNVGPLPTSLAYRLVGTENGAARVEWLGETDHTADELVSNRAGLGDSEERDALCGFLTDYVRQRGGECTAKEVADAAANNFGPIPKATLKRARDRAGIRTRKSAMTGGWMWTLIGDPEPEGSTKVPKVPPLPIPEPSEPSVEPSAAQGPCAACGTATRRYGEGGHPMCPQCRAAADVGDAPDRQRQQPA